MYMYDQAHVLVKAIRESEEYKLLKARKGKLEQDESLKKMFTDYRTKQFEIQRVQLVGETVPDDKRQAFRQLHEVVVANPVLKEFLEAEHRFSTIMADIQKILVDGLDLMID